MNISALKRILNPNTLFELIQKHWISYVQKEFGLIPSDYFADTELLDKMSEDKQKLYAIVDIVRFKFDYFGKNSEEFCGYTDTEFLEKGMFHFIHALPLSQLSFFWNILEWSRLVLKKYPIDLAKDYWTYSICGLNIKHKSGRVFPIFIRAYGLQKMEDGRFLKIILEITNATNLIKTNDYWTHYTLGKEKKETICFFSNKDFGSTANLISVRELEVLRLIAENKSSKEIGEQLFISVNTVERHRKNMIARVGAIDTLALVEICRRCGII
jgi:DNA-binding CsgD family transcriptional regulator